MATVVFLPLAPGHGTVLVSRAGLFLPRTTAAVARPWALPSARRGSPRSPAVRRLRPGEPRHGELAIGGRQLDPGASPPPSLRKSDPLDIRGLVAA